MPMSNRNTEAIFSLRTTAIGRLELWDSRVFVQDALSGFYALREQMTREIGAEFTADILYRTGFSTSEQIMAFVADKDTEADGQLSLDLALALLTEAGYGWVRQEDGSRRAGEIAVRIEHSLEGEMMSDRAGRSGYFCDYMRGLLRGIVQHLPRTEGFPFGLVECVEIACIVNDDPDCRFVIASPEHLAQHGYRLGDDGYNSVRETLLRLNRQLEDVLEAAQRDSLTGLYNRAHFESVLRNKIEYANRRTDTLAVAMIDVDGFKQVNDTQGHGMGDLALRQVGHLLASHARDTDVVARYGGDEFAWLMPGTSVEAALAVADRMRRLVQEMQSQIDLPLSLSIGIAACPADATSMAELIDLADAAMYLSKDSGGNQVKRYRAEEDHRTASQKRVRKPRPRQAPTPTPKPAPAAGSHPSLDLKD